MAELKQTRLYLYEPILESAYKLPDDERDKFLLSVVHYITTDEEPTFEDEHFTAKLLFEAYKKGLDKSKAQCRNGKKGGGQKGNQNARKNNPTNEPKTSQKRANEQPKNEPKERRIKESHTPFFSQKIGRSTGEGGIC